MLPENIKQKLIAHAKKEYPNECCGILINKNNVIEYIECENKALNKTETFLIDNNYLIEYDDFIIGIVHSHPNGNNRLSNVDLKMQINTALDWYLIANDTITKHKYIPRLIGRNFNFPTFDCYTLFKDLYSIGGVHLPEMTYIANWAEMGQNLYIENLIKCGFEQVAEPDLCDVILFQMGTNVPNHAGIYVGKQYFIHHAIGQLSKRDLLSGYWLKHFHSFWGYKCKSQLNCTEILNVLEIHSTL